MTNNMGQYPGADIPWITKLASVGMFNYPLLGWLVMTDVLSSNIYSKSSVVLCWPPPSAHQFPSMQVPKRGRKIIICFMGNQGKPKQRNQLFLWWIARSGPPGWVPNSQRTATSWRWGVLQPLGLDSFRSIKDHPAVQPCQLYHPVELSMHALFI